MDLLLPLATLALATAGLALLVEPFLSWYYQWAWWSYIFAVDAINRRLDGSSLVRGRPRQFVGLCALSVVFWTFFEALNLRLGNWYYVMDHSDRIVRWTGGVVAFATVLPGVLGTEGLLASAGCLRRVPVTRLRWSRAADGVCLAIGLAALLLPLAWPDVFYPVTWGSLIFLMEPWNRRHARRSVLRELEDGEAGPLLRTLVAGLLCGLLWEAWNFWARSRWIYTVPGVGGPKVFEMPLLGFLGFPPFAVECVAVASFAEAWWDRAKARRGAQAGALRMGAVSAAVVGVLAVFVAADSRTVDSTYVPVEQLEVLPAPDRVRLAASGLRSPEALLRALGREEGLREWSARTGISPEELRTLRERVALLMHRGLGQDRARELAALGIRTRQDLSGWTHERLVGALREAGARDTHRFLERRARVWLEGLRGPGR